MLFNSIEFTVFYLVFFSAFFLLKTTRLQLTFIALASLYFYSAWNPWYVSLLFVTCTLAFFAQEGKLSRSAAVAILLSLLFFFKYYNFAVGQFALLSGGLGRFDTVDVVLPAGISFYVFHAISLIVDRSRGIIPSTQLMPLISYIAFFPQLIAGPIIRAHTFVPQLQTPRVFNAHMFRNGMFLFAAGMFKKLVVADNIGVFVDSVYDTHGSTTAGNHILAFYLYAIQIYFDFCGYSDMAIGIARTLGFRFPINFARPYLSASITEFWRRWHISLSTWLRLYLYYPLGGNRNGPKRTYLNLALVMLLGGLWHGAAWTFVFWGGIHGIALAIERAMGYAPHTRLHRCVGAFITFHLVCVSWVFFRAPDFSSAGAYFQGMADVDSIFIVTTKFTVAKCLMLAVLFIIIERFSVPQSFLKLRNKQVLISVGIIYAVLFLLFGNFAAHPFIYFQF